MKKRKSILRKVTALAAVISLLVCMAGCSKDGSENSLEPITNRAEDGTYFDSGDTLCRGVWAADDGEKRVGYYIFYDGENGRFEDAHLGMSVPFAVKIKKDKVLFALGAADFSDPASVKNTGDGTRELTWLNENRVENLSLLGELEPDSFRYYSQNDLSEMAMDFYESRNGKRPDSADVFLTPDGMATILLYGKRGYVVAGYSVDSITGKGTVNGTEEEIVLAADQTGE